MTKPCSCTAACLIALAVLSPARPAHAGTSFSTNLLAIPLGFYGLEVTQSVGSVVSVVGEVAFTNRDTTEGFFQGHTGPSLAAGLKLYPFSSAPTGLFLLPSAEMTLLSTGFGSAGEVGWRVRASAGWDFVLWERLLVSPGIGACWNASGVSPYGRDERDLTPILRLNFGVQL